MNRSILLAWCLCVFGLSLPAAETLPLAGEWRFALDRADAGLNEKWFTKDLSDNISLPGILQAQGFGDDIATNTPWVLGLGDAWWKIQPAALRETFSQPGNVKVPFLSQPPKHFLGAAWYQRDVEIPTNWSGKHFTLFLERVHWKSTVWLDEKEIGSDISLSTPHEFDLGVVGQASRLSSPSSRQTNSTGKMPVPLQIKPGIHRLTIRVDNRTQLPNAGHLLDSHSISDALGATWNGIVGKIELRATPPVWVEDMEIFPNFARQVAIVKIVVANQTSRSTKMELQFSPQAYLNVTSAPPILTVPVEITSTLPHTVFHAEIDFTKAFYPWDEFEQSLYNLAPTVNWNDGAISDTSKTIFGFRQITVRDKDILINGRPVNLRLTHFGGDFPLTGHPPMDVASWKKIIATCKDYGLNGIRFHSWCPPEAAFAAADELGFYLQPECPLWADFGNAETRQFLEDETARILKAYGNHPSFILLSPSNEPKNYSRYLPQWAATNYTRDNRRLYSAATGWSDPSQVNGGAQFATLVRYGDGQLRNSSGWFGNDFSRALNDVHIPVLSHEVGQWCAYPDFDVMRKFTGYLQPGNYEIFKYIAEQNGVAEMNHEFALASGRFQLGCYKEEIEANLRTPGLAGFQLLDLHDYLGQGTALIGVLDALWESKGYVTPEEFRKFCGPVVPLAWLKKRVFTTADKMDVDIGVANFGNGTLRNAVVHWEIHDDTGRTVAFCPSVMEVNIPVGSKERRLNLNLDLEKFSAPAHYKLIATVKAGDKNYANDWNFWVYPASVDNSKVSDVLVTRDWNAAEKNLADGKKVLFLPTGENLDSSKCPPMKSMPVFWNIQMTVRPPQNRTARFDAMLGLLCDTNHPALAEFPTDKNCDWQWTPLVNGVRSVNLTAAPRELQPIVWAIDDWNRNWKLGVIFECNVGKGRLLVSAIDLDDDRGGSQLKQLRRSLLDYMGGETFQPKTTLTLEQVQHLWSRGVANASEPTRVFDPDLNDGSTPEKAARKKP